MVDLYREKSRKHAQAQKLYDTLKQKYQAGQMQSAASANVAQAIESIDAERRPETFNVLPTLAHDILTPPPLHTLKADTHDRRPFMVPSSSCILISDRGAVQSGAPVQGII